MSVASHEFQTGKRFLANMMGEDPTTFTQEDIDVSDFMVVKHGIVPIIFFICD